MRDMRCRGLAGSWFQLTSAACSASTSAACSASVSATVSSDDLPAVAFLAFLAFVFYSWMCDPVTLVSR